jgi:hypothetical protein
LSEVWLLNFLRSFPIHRTYDECNGCHENALTQPYCHNMTQFSTQEWLTKPLANKYVGKLYISQSWNKAVARLGLFPLPTIIPVRSQREVVIIYPAETLLAAVHIRQFFTVHVLANDLSWWSSLKKRLRVSPLPGRSSDKSKDDNGTR